MLFDGRRGKSSLDMPWEQNAEDFLLVGAREETRFLVVRISSDAEVPHLETVPSVLDQMLSIQHAFAERLSSLGSACRDFLAVVHCLSIEQVRLHSHRITSMHEQLRQDIRGMIAQAGLPWEEDLMPTLPALSDVLEITQALQRPFSVRCELETTTGSKHIVVFVSLGGRNQVRRWVERMVSEELGGHISSVHVYICDQQRVIGQGHLPWPPADQVIEVLLTADQPISVINVFISAHGRSLFFAQFACSSKS